MRLAINVCQSFQNQPWEQHSYFDDIFTTLEQRTINVIYGFLRSVTPMPGMLKSAQVILSQKFFVEFLVVYYLDSNMAQFRSDFDKTCLKTNAQKYFSQMGNDFIKVIFNDICKMFFTKEIRPFLKFYVPGKKYKHYKYNHFLPKVRIYKVIYILKCLSICFTFNDCFKLILL